MKQITLLCIFLINMLYANLNVAVSILPQKHFLKAIGGDRVEVTLMVLPGNSPHTYEPKPSQMKAIANAQLYFAIGVEFEKVWLPKFKALNPKLKVIDLSEGIEKLPVASVHHHTDMHHHGEERGMDPHIWTAPENVVKIVQHIFAALSLADPENKVYYKKNLEAFLQKIEETDKTIREILSGKPKDTAFMVFHPSWGYFARAYGLRQLPVEVEGKEPKPRELIALIKEAEEEKVSAVFTQPEFSDSAAKVIADELHVPVIKVSPLAEEWSENLIRIAKAIAGES
jgi:zinc transport system substrate-binding protein